MRFATGWSIFRESCCELPRLIELLTAGLSLGDGRPGVDTEFAVRRIRRSSRA